MAGARGFEAPFFEALSDP